MVGLFQSSNSCSWNHFIINLEKSWTESSYVMFCVIWYHLYNLKNAKSILLIVTLLHGCFSHFLNCKNNTKLCKASHISDLSAFLFPTYTKKIFLNRNWLFNAIGIFNFRWRCLEKHQKTFQGKCVYCFP